ncbi:hypothetical protein [uncultured Pelagimonas sp.]|uniref:hypothetical protein n=1 Tax=uncultured Pelagimonas sp. TaxID=1618102 RepID=UPI002602C544|nr:hypothetical protein [uncultured Pelagimonas sp.]
MTHLPDPKSFSVKSWLKIVFVSLFIMIWLTGMTAGLMAGACRNDRYDGEKKLRFCNISLTEGSFFDFSATERAKSAAIRVEQAIALAQLGREDEARAAIETAIKDVGRDKRRLRDLHLRMKSEPHLGAFRLWIDVMKEPNRRP